MMNEGFIIIDKPKGLTSFDVVAKLRKITGVRKIGHCGTLDPLATGVLVCAIGRSATKKISEIQKTKKEYIATAELGRTSVTYDLEGPFTEFVVEKKPTKEQVLFVLKKFIGEIDQTPPIYSAKKIGGRRAYEMARKGEDVLMKKIKVKIFKIKLISYKYPHIKIKINCGSGTYIRSLANDIGVELGTGAFLQCLTRTQVGIFNLKNAFHLDKLTNKNIFKKLFVF